MLTVLNALSPYIWIMLHGTLQLVVGYRSKAHNKSTRYAEPTIKHILLPAGCIFAAVGALSVAKGWILNPKQFMPLRLIGWAIVLAGISLGMWAQRCLGSNWVGGIGVVKNHQLVSHGPYRFVRHPLYSGMLVSAAGVALVSVDPFCTLGAFAFALALVVRYPFEERVLLNRLRGKRLAAYKTYRQTTPALFPAYEEAKHHRGISNAASSHPVVARSKK